MLWGNNAYQLNMKMVKFKEYINKFYQFLINNPIRNKQGNIIQVGDYHIEYEYVYPYGRRIKQLVRY